MKSREAHTTAANATAPTVIAIHAVGRRRAAAASRRVVGSPAPPGIVRRSVAAICAADSKRRAGSFASARSRIARSGSGTDRASSGPGGGGVSTCISSVATGSDARKGTAPVSSSYSTTPSE